MILAALAVAGCLAAASCNGASQFSAPPVTLRIAGSSAMRPLLEDLATAYEIEHPNVTVALTGGDSETGLQALARDEAEIAAVSWQVEGDETGPHQATPIARDALTIIASPENPASGLTILQLRAIFRGELLDWQAVGGSNAEPEVISREDGSGDRAAFEALVMGGDRVTLNARVLPTAAAVAEYVAAHPAAIGYVSMAQDDGQVNALRIEGAAPTAENVRSGAYHLNRLLYLYVPRQAPAATRAFLDFVLSPAGQSIVAQHYASLR
jgi:phosphate transport system substrate-binding protein